MKMTSFRIQNYRCIHDSGWIDTDNIAVVVGKNESGKTSLLKALWKLKPFKNEPYSLDREWPRGNRKEKSGDKPVSTVRFEFNDKEKEALKAIHASAKEIAGTEVTRNYDGNYLYSFSPKMPMCEQEWVTEIITATRSIDIEVATEQFKGKFKTELEATIKRVFDKGTKITDAVAEMQRLNGQLASFVVQPEDNAAVEKIRQNITATIAELNNKDAPVRRIIKIVREWLPIFIYMDDYKAFRGTAQLNEIKQRKDNGSLTEENKTLICIMEMAGLNLEQEVQKGNQQDREQRILDMNDASQTLTSMISDRWRQKKYEVMFQADGQHFITFVKDADSKVLVPLEERSKGFQWFFSFDMEFMYETKGTFKDAIILLDEPGLHLHAAAQRDLLERMKEYSKNNQLIYTTHLPFMIDFARLDNIWVAEEKKDDGVVVNKDWATADKDARFTLQAALGLSWSQSLFVGQYNLVVEGVTDFWYLMTLSTIFQEAGLEGIDEQLVITPAGGASKVAYVGTILHGQNLNVAVLLDSDSQGMVAYDQLVKQWILDDKHVLMLGNILGLTHFCAIEDLFDEDYYLEHVNKAYSKELNQKKLKVPSDPNQPIVDRVDTALKKLGIENFNKGRVGKLIMMDLSKKKLADISGGAQEKIKKVIAAINKMVAGWKQK